jgi:hypothetical protein
MQLEAHQWAWRLRDLLVNMVHQLQDGVLADLVLAALLNIDTDGLAVGAVLA